MVKSLMFRVAGTPLVVCLSLRMILSLDVIYLPSIAILIKSDYKQLGCKCISLQCSRLPIIWFRVFG